MQTECHAPDADRVKRERHKPCIGVEDNKFMISCVWCGKTLEFMELEEARKACMIESVERILDYGI